MKSELMKFWPILVFLVATLGAVIGYAYDQGTTAAELAALNQHNTAAIAAIERKAGAFVTRDELQLHLAPIREGVERLEMQALRIEEKLDRLKR